MNSIFLTGRKTLVKDIIHNSIQLSPIATAIIDTPIFQRLRDLHQLGVCYLIFPNANNNRFEHSIGTYHLTGLMLEKIISNSKNQEINKALIETKFIKKYLLKHLELEDNEKSIKFIKNLDAPLIDNYLIELIKIAGLIHDVGHGPFSHLFDGWIHSMNKSGEFDSSMMLEHETRSVMLFEKMIADKKIKLDGDEYYIHDFIDEEAIKFIAELINPTSSTPSNFIFQIVSNSLNGFDVDKLDYICRDSFYLGLDKPTSLLTSVISQVKVINGNICFPDDISYDVYQIYSKRYGLHKQFYANKKVVCIEHMITDVFDNLDPILKFTDIIKNNKLEQFSELTDSVILNTAKIYKESQPIYQLYKEQIDQIQQIMHKINTRNIYKCIYNNTFHADRSITNEQIFDEFKTNLRKINLTEIDFDTNDLDINSSKLKIVKIKIGLFGGNKSHPLDSVYFYKQNENESFLLDKEKISHLMSSSYQETLHYIIYKT